MMCSAEVVDITITSMILLAIQSLIYTTHSKAMPDRLVEVHQDLDITFSSPKWLAQIPSSASEEPSDLALRLALRVLRPESGTWDRSDISEGFREMLDTIDNFIRINVVKTSSFYLASLARTRKAITMILANLLLSQRSSIASNRDTSEEGISKSTLARHQHERLLASRLDEEKKMLKHNGLEMMENELRGLARRIHRIVGFNMDVFGEMYASGMGSERV